MPFPPPFDISAAPALTPATTDRVLAWPSGATSVTDVGYRTVSSFGGGGGGGGSGAGWFHVLDYGGSIANFGNNMVDDQTAAFQACFDAAYAYAQGHTSGAVVVIDPGQYRIHGSVILSNLAVGDGELTVLAHGCRIIHKPGTTNVPMFKYVAPANITEQNSFNELRKLRWFGGFYDGDRLVGQHGWDLPCTARCVFADMHVQAFDYGFYARFSLSSTWRNINFVSNKGYDIYLREGDWPGSSNANSAPNMNRIQQTRHYGNGTAEAAIRIDQGGGNVIDQSVFEGAGGTYNIRIYTSNTSAVLNTVRDIWCENSTTADVKVQTLHQVSISFQFALNGVLVDAADGAASVELSVAYASGSTQFTAISGQKWLVHKMRSNFEWDHTNTNWWVGGVVPNVIYHGLSEGGGARHSPSTGGTWNITGYVAPDQEWSPATVTLGELAQSVATLIRDLADAKLLRANVS